MTDLLTRQSQEDDGQNGDVKPGGKADFLPDFYGAPIAAGPEIETLDVRSSRLDGGVFRRQVPTERQIEEGAKPVLDDLPLHLPVEEPEPAAKPTLGQRVYSWFDGINPMRIEGPKLPLVVLGLGTLLAGWDDRALALIGPELRAEFGTSITLLTTLSSITGVVVLLLGLPMGYLYDRVKRVRLVRVGYISSNVSSLLRALAPSFPWFVGGALVGTAGGVIDGPGVGPLIADYYPSRARGRALLFLRFTGTVGGLIGAPIVTFVLVRMGDWRPAVALLAIMATGVSLLSFLLKEPVRGGMDRLEMGATREVAAMEQSPPSFMEAIRGGWAIRTVRVQAYVSVVSMFAGPVGMYTSLIQAEKFQLDVAQRGALQTLSGLVSLPTFLLAGRLMDRLLTKKPSALILYQSMISFVGAIVTLASAFAPNLFLFVAPGLIFGVLTGLMAPAVQVIMIQVIPARFRATAGQVLTPFQLVGLAVAPALTSFAERLDIQTGLFMFTPFYIAAGFVGLMAVTTIERDIRAARAASMVFVEARRSRETGDEKLLVCRDIDVSYEQVQILSHVDFDVRKGECVALLGTNGAGKSTLLRAIAGQVEPDNGAIMFNGIDTTHVPAHENAKNGIVMMPGGQAVFPTMSVRENLTTAVWMQRKDDDAADNDARIEQVLDFFPVLRDRLDVPAGALSGGEQQMLALSQAFLMRPLLLMIDELSLGLAPVIVEQLLGILRQIRENGTTVLLVEQSLNVALTIAERAVFMEKGEIKLDGPTEELLQRPDLVRSIFMGGAIGGGAVARGRRDITSAEADTGPSLSATDISVSFGGVRALSDVSVDVRQGEIVGIIGPNGAGKTTLFDVLSGYVDPNAGNVLFRGEDVTKLSPDARARRGLGRAFQNARLFPPLTVRENIAIALERRAVKNPLAAALWTPHLRRSERLLQSRIDGFIEILGLGGFADKFVKELSTGTRRAVEMACVMASEPRILLLDEPSSGLAQAETEALGPTLLRVVRDTGCGLLIIEHDVTLITSISDRLVAMELGTVLLTGPPDEVTQHPRVVQSYLAASPDVMQRSGSRVGAVLEALEPHRDDEPPA